MPKYYAPLRNAAKTLARYERLERQKAETPQERYGRWMYSRRSSEWTEYVIDQIQGIHDVAHHLDDEIEVCTCGLIAPNSETQVYLAFGHLQGGEVATLLIHNFQDGRGHELYCQNCCGRWAVVRREDVAGDGQPLIDLEATLAQHPGCVRIEHVEGSAE